MRVIGHRGDPVRHGARMQVVALRPGLDRGLGRAWRHGPWLRALAEAAGLAQYELRMRLRMLDGWPGVLATFAESSSAEATAAALVSAGMRAWVRPGAVHEACWRVRRFSRVGPCLRLEREAGGDLEVPAADVRMLLHGVQYDDDRVAHGAGRRAPGVVGGASWLTARLDGSQSSGSTGPRSDPFVRVYVRGIPPLVLRAGSLRYRGPGERVPEPTRVANFRRVVADLRQACPAAIYDDRLRGRIEQTRVLGPTLRPEQHLDLAIALVVGEVMRVDSPYR